MKKAKFLIFSLLLCVTLTCFVGAYTAKIYDEDGTTLLKTAEFTKGVSTAISDISKNGTETRYFLGFKTADGKQLHNGNIHTEHEGDLELRAAWLTRKEPVIGEEFIENGDFIGNNIPFHVSNGSAVIVTESDGNRVLEYSRGSAHASIQHYMKWEKGRKYRISYRFKLPSSVANTINMRYFESQSELDSNATADNGGSYKTGTAGQWVSHTADITVSDSLISSYKRDAVSFYSEPQKGLANDDTWGVVYYDDISVIPMYKITYDANGGTLSSGGVDWCLGDTYTVDSSIAPVRKGYAFLGWGTSSTSSVSVNEVELENKDVTLYARWTLASNQPMFTYNFSSNVKGIADGAMSIVAKDGAEGSTSVTLYYADDNGILSDYTPLKTLKLNDGTATLGVSGKRAFPDEATKIHVVFSGENMEDYTYIYDIPEEKRITNPGTPIVSFYNLSDAHNANEGSEYILDGRSVAINRANAVNDVIANKDKYDFIIFNGDNVNHSTQAMFGKFGEFINTFNNQNIPMFFNNGNHEFHVPTSTGEGPDLENGVEEIFLGMLNDQITYLNGLGYEIDKEENDWYYSVVINGIKFIFCSTPFPNYETAEVEYSLSGKQLTWLEEQLFDAEKSNTPVFLLSHVGLGKYIPGTNDGLTNVDELESVLNRHANLFMGTAHTHTNINADIHTVYAGDQKKQFTHYNEGSISFTTDKSYYEDGAKSSYETDYCMGYYIEVYKDRVVFKGRLFEDAEDGGCKFISHAHYTIMMPGADKELPELTISGSLTDGSTLTPVLSENYSSAVSSYEWYIDGKKVSAASTYKLNLTNDNAGKKIACRVNFADGTYVSALTDGETAHTTVFFDFNGGTGSVMANQKVLPGATFTPNVPSVLPTKKNHYFAGWSTNKNAADPDETFTANGETITLYAVYKEGYTVTYNINGGTGSVPADTVTAKGAFVPNTGKPFPTKQGFYFMGWAETQNAERAAKSVDIKADTTLYAVWSAEPKWYFENLAGFVPNSFVTEYKIEDGILSYSTKGAEGSDMQFTLNKQLGSFKAEDYPYLRIKSRAFNSSGVDANLFDSLYFSTETQGYSYSKTRIPLGSATKMATVDNMSIIEIKIPDFSCASGYTGTVKSLRYDVFEQKDASGYTDYLVFSDKRGIYKANITVGNYGDENVTLSADTVNCTASVQWTKTDGKETVSVKLVPATGYEFTTEDDVLALTTINGSKPDTAVILADGSAVITLVKNTAKAEIPVKNGDTLYVYENGKIIETNKITSDGTFSLSLKDDERRYVVVNGKNESQKYYRLDAKTEGYFVNVSDLDNGILGSDSVSVRTTAPQGIRFFASVSNKLVADGSSVAEYGFILTAESAHNNIGSDYLLGMEFVKNGKAKKGVAYSKEENIDIYMSKDSERTSLAGVLYGIPKTEDGVKTVIAARPYYMIKETNGDVKYVYGETAKSSLYDIAKKIYGNTEFESAWEYAKEIIDLVETDENNDDKEIVVDAGKLYE